MTSRGDPTATPSDELRFSALFAQAAAGLAELDPQGHFTLVNDGFCALVGRSREYLLTLRMHDITHPEDLARNMALFDAAALRGEPYRIQKRYVRPDGTDVWVDKSVSVVRAPDGGIARLFAITQDISARKETEAAAAESEDRFRLIADSAPTPIWVTKPDGKRAFVNRSYVDFLGVPYDDALDFDWRQRLHPDDHDRILREQVAGERSKALFTLEARYSDLEGRWRWLRSQSQPRCGAGGEHLGFIGVAFDITEAKRAEADLREMNDLLEQRVHDRTAALETLYNQTPTLLHSQLPDGRLVSVSDRWLEFMGYAEREDVIGRPITEFMAPESREQDRARRWLDVLASSRFADRDGFDDIEYRAVKKSGEIADVLVSGRVERDARGRMLRTLVAMTDSTARKRAEDALRQAQKMEAVGQLTGGIAHDFNNLLTIIRSSADLLKRGNLTDERRDRYIDAIASTADRAAALTGQLLAFARRQPLRPEVFDVCLRLGSLRELVQSALGGRVSLSIDTGDMPCLVEADPNQFDTALLNLVSNARDAMQGQGTLSIRVFAGGDRLIGIDVTDNGEGIAPALLPHVFEPFYTTKAVGKGTGLGLSQVYGFAKQSGGEVRVDSTVGVGTTITFSLPRARRGLAAAVPADDAERCNRQGPARRLRVLVVEDNAAVGDNAVQVLRDLGHMPVLADNAAAAIERFGTQGDSFDVVFSDVVMPGMSGLELATALRRLAPAMPIVLTSGYSDALVAGSGSEFELVGKPYSVDQVADALARVTS